MVRVTRKMTAAEGAAVMRGQYGSRAHVYAQRRRDRAQAKGDDRRARMWAAIAEELTEDGWTVVAPGHQWTHPRGGVIYETATGFEWHANKCDGWDVPTLAQAKRQAEEAM